MDLNSINKARTVYYGLFASLFAFNMSEDHFKNIVHSVDRLSNAPIDDQTGVALTLLKESLESGGYSGLKNENDMVFFSPTTSFTPMTASYYSEERDDGKKRVEMMNYVLQSKFRRNSDEYKENEDHIEFICLFMQKLIYDELQGEKHSQCLGKNIFKDILNDMLNPLCQRLAEHENSHIYGQVAIILKSFADIERLFFDINAPAIVDASRLAKPNIKLGKEKKAAREMVKRNHDEFSSI
ncbi:TorD/DmsD family molecular chaperone [Desulfotalea psychrophila]|uniref:Uncharacterized protein n=1 Tax=Desulfotalea psychrophila (strain LSv54 / DSM 12343) TaxID=177439 RepID=Q6AIW7_DESPS|nr:molecular chaperone TorD family protein [Desulfotalea psychrophila]CAG37713.1 hypothetical protein DP2984 [Desulfotalea psychrophila LSv54]